jgi:hypothetical protein
MRIDLHIAFSEIDLQLFSCTPGAYTGTSTHHSGTSIQWSSARIGVPQYNSMQQRTHWRTCVFHVDGPEFLVSGVVHYVLHVLVLSYRWHVPRAREASMSQRISHVIS